MENMDELECVCWAIIASNLTDVAPDSAAAQADTMITLLRERRRPPPPAPPVKINRGPLTQDDPR